MKPLRLILVNLGRRSGTFQLTTPPLGILYLAAYLRVRFDLQIQIIDQKVDNLNEERAKREWKAKRRAKGHSIIVGAD